jgi:hypothetical protein
MMQWLAGAKRDSVFRFQNHLLLEEKIRQLRVGRKLESHRGDDLLEEIAERFLP